MQKAKNYNLRTSQDDQRSIHIIVSSSDYSIHKTPRVGFEPTTNRLTADRSTTELPRIAQRFTTIATQGDFTQVINEFFLNRAALSVKSPSLKPFTRWGGWQLRELDRYADKGQIV